MVDGSVEKRPSPNRSANRWQWVSRYSGAMKVLTFNLWSDGPRRAWHRRRDRMAELLKAADTDLMGFQEATRPMLRDLEERLPDFAWIGHGRDDGRDAGEFTPIFYRADRWRLREHATFWLSVKCELPGRGWDAYCNRTVTWARFESVSDGISCLHFNTHLDHLGRRARLQSAHLLLRKIQSIGGADPVVVTGDFNCRESSAPYRTLVGKLPFSPPAEGVEPLRDTFYESEKTPIGPPKTYRGWMSFFGIGRIDYVFVKNGLRTVEHRTIDDRPPVSDHRSVLVELAFTEKSSKAGMSRLE
jgi:endonuclease/exonuclease/phosphatase family metal-dependent hydrolase